MVKSQTVMESHFLRFRTANHTVSYSSKCPSHVWSKFKFLTNNSSGTSSLLSSAEKIDEMYAYITFLKEQKEDSKVSRRSESISSKRRHINSRSDVTRFRPPLFVAFQRRINDEQNLLNILESCCVAFKKDFWLAFSLVLFHWY